jgi:hypothetical protein
VWRTGFGRGHEKEGKKERRKERQKAARTVGFSQIGHNSFISNP